MPPTILGSMLGSMAKGWLGLAPLDGSVNRAAVPPGSPITITTASSSSQLDANLPEDCSGGGGREDQINICIYFKEGKDYQNDSLQVYTTQGVRHKFTCGKQAIHRCNPTKNLCDQTINLCKVAASILISSHHW